jgi:hypothetical protein
MGGTSGVEQGLGRAWALTAGVMWAAMAAGAVQAQPAPSPAASAPPGDFPATTSESDILRWVATRTTIPRASILMIEPRAVAALAGRSAPGVAGSLAHAEVREELISPDARIRSAIFSVDLDCAGHRFRVIQRKTYLLPDLKGEGQVNPQPGPWSQINDGAPVAKAWQAVCTTDFVFPYAAPRTATAAAPAAKRGGAQDGSWLPPPIAFTSSAPPAPRTPAATGTASSARPAPAAGGPYEVVLGSYTVKSNALAASAKLDQVLAREMAGHAKALVTATVKGKVYTVLTVGGFGSAADAAGFCQAAKAIPLACLVKRGGG